MINYRKKYQNVVEKKSHLDLISKDHNTIESLESQALDAFSVEATGKEYYMQRMGQIQINSIRQRRYILKNYKNQARITFPGKKRKIPILTQTLDNFILKSKERPKLIIQKPIFFKIYSRPTRKVLIEEQLDSFMCPRKLKPLLQLQNVHNLLFEKEKKLICLIESLKGFLLPADGKFFNNKPILKEGGMFEFEFLKIKAPFKFSNSSKLFIPKIPKKIRYTELITQKNPSVTYIINKVKVFTPSYTIMKKAFDLLIPRQPKKTSFTDLSLETLSSLLIPQQPKKTSFDLLSIEKALNVLYDIIPKIKTFEMVSIENLNNLFIPGKPKKRYYAASTIDSFNYNGIEKPENCLEIDPNEEIFIPNAYDMLLIQNFWDDLQEKSFRVCIRPSWYKSTKDLALIKSNSREMSEKNNNDNNINNDNNNNNNNEENKNEENKDESKEDNKEILKELKDESEDKDVLRDFKEKKEKRRRDRNARKNNSNNNLFLEKGENNVSKISKLKDQSRAKDNKGKGVTFKDLKKKIFSQ